MQWVCTHQGGYTYNTETEMRGDDMIDPSHHKTTQSGLHVESNGNTKVVDQLDHVD